MHYTSLSSSVLSEDDDELTVKIIELLTLIIAEELSTMYN